MATRDRRKWLQLWKYESKYGPLNYGVSDLRTEPDTCKWCLGELKSNRQKSYCSNYCRVDYANHYVYGRNRPPVPWRIVCRDHFACRKCGWASRMTNDHGIEHYSVKGLEVHHINHVANGGSDHESNLLTLCRECHLDEHRIYNAWTKKEV